MTHTPLTILVAKRFAAEISPLLNTPHTLLTYDGDSDEEMQENKAKELKSTED